MLRLIPAHAGKTLLTWASADCAAAHPRSRGENNLKMLETDFGSGSSPLTRGKPGPVELSTKKTRLIPAHAGKTRGAELIELIGKAHPRSRGENDLTRSPQSFALGSSPLTRGKLTASEVWGGTERLIPAHAGKTKSVIMTGVARAAHPRSRGENLITLRLVR